MSLVRQTGEGAKTREIISLRLAAENSMEEGHTLLTLFDGIYQTYLQLMNNDSNKALN